MPFLSQYLRETGRDGFHSLISHPYKHLRHRDEKGPGMEPWQAPYWKEPSLLSWLWKDEVTMSSALPELSRRQVLSLRESSSVVWSEQQADFPIRRE